MKKILLVLAIALASVQFSQAQTSQGDISVGGGLAYGTGAFDFGGDLNNSLGIQLGGYYTIAESKLRAGLDFIYYFPSSEGGVDFNLWELNANAHYIFVEEADFLCTVLEV